MARIRMLLTICLALFMPCATFAWGTNVTDTVFVQVKTSGDIILYERWYPVTPIQQAREVKATFTVRTRPQAAAALIRDQSKARLWNKNTKTYRVLPANGNSWICYIQYDLPWPVSNQDCVLEYNQLDRGDSYEVSFKAVDHPSFPVRKKVDRIPDVSGKWIFTESADELKVEYYITTTPSNTLPTWLTDPIIRNNLIETMVSFRRILEASPES